MDGLIDPVADTHIYIGAPIGVVEIHLHTGSLKKPPWVGRKLQVLLLLIMMLVLLLLLSTETTD